VLFAASTSECWKIPAISTKLPAHSHPQIPNLPHIDLEKQAQLAFRCGLESRFAYYDDRFRAVGLSNASVGFTIQSLDTAIMALA